MSKMSELSLSIQELLEDGMDVTTVAHQLNVPLDWVIHEDDALRGEEHDGQPSEYDEWMSFDSEC